MHTLTTAPLVLVLEYHLPINIETFITHYKSVLQTEILNIKKEAQQCQADQSNVMKHGNKRFTRDGEKSIFSIFLSIRLALSIIEASRID